MENEKKYILCRYCKNEMKPGAKVCFTCGKHQNWFWEHVSVTNSISFLVLILASIQLIIASMERSKAEEAYNKALDAKNEVVNIEKEVRMSEIKITEVGKAIINIAEILPRSIGYGAGLNDRDQNLLKKSVELIKEYSKNDK